MWSICKGENPVFAVAVGDNFIPGCSAVSVLTFPTSFISSYIKSEFHLHQAKIHNTTEVVNLKLFVATEVMPELL